MLLMKRFPDRTGINGFISSYGFEEPGSNSGYGALQVMQSFWVSLWIGAGRFSHTSILQHDRALQKIFGWTRSPSKDTYRRFFQKFDMELSSDFFHSLSHWFFSQLVLDHYTLDVDSSVWTRYGSRQGAKKGYNPKKRGRPSHHPLMAFVSDIKMVCNFWLRPGNTSSANNIIAFPEETFSILRQ